MQEPIKTGDRATIIAGALGDKGPNIGKQVTWWRVKPRPSGRGRKARSPSGLLWAPPINQQP